MLPSNIVFPSDGAYRGAITARQVAILVPDDKLDCFKYNRNKFGSDINGLALYPGPVLPPRADGSQLNVCFCCLAATAQDDCYSYINSMAPL